MILVIGGAFQGKGDFARKQFGIEDEDVLACEAVFSESTSVDLSGLSAGKKLIRNLHAFTGSGLKQGFSTEKLKDEVLRVIEAAPEIIITCDELGCGVIPMDPYERLYREETGRILCDLAAKADAVYRVFCGIATRIK